MNKVTVPKETIEGRMDQIRAWLRENAGIGSTRFGGREGHINHWLSGDDWLCYEEYSMAVADDEFTTSQYVFVFRDEKAATEFALRFA